MINRKYDGDCEMENQFETTQKWLVTQFEAFGTFKKKHFLGALVIITEVYSIPHIALVVRGTNQFLARSMGQLISRNFLANILHN